MPNTYDVGDLVRCFATFMASGNTPADPAQVWFLTNSAAGRSTALYGTSIGSITRVATGAYYSDVNITKSGAWAYRWEATGGMQSAVETSFNVNPTFHF